MHMIYRMIQAVRTFLFGLCVLIGTAHGQALPTIVAVVGDDIITTKDMKDRVHLAKVLSHMQDAEDSTLYPQVLQLLIDERLVEQEAARLGVTVDPQDMKRTIQNVESQQQLSKNGFEQYLKDNKLDHDSIMRQLKGQILWTKILQSKIRPKVQLRDQEVAGLLSFISADSSVKVSFKQVYKSIDTPVNHKQVTYDISELERFRKRVKGCHDFEKKASDLKGFTYGQQALSMKDLHADIRDAVFLLPVGQISPVIHSPSALRLVIVCKKQEASDEREQVEQMIFNKRLGSEAKHMMSRLRRDTYIDIK